MLDNEWTVWAGIAVLFAGLYWWSQSRLERALRDRDRALGLAEYWRLDAVYWKKRLDERALRAFVSPRTKALPFADGQPAAVEGYEPGATEQTAPCKPPSSVLNPLPPRN